MAKTNYSIKLEGLNLVFRNNSIFPVDGLWSIHLDRNEIIVKFLDVEQEVGDLGEAMALIIQKGML